MELKIDDDFKNLIPPLKEDEFSKLEKGILQDGIRDKLIVWNETIIDGHNRYAIAKKHDLTIGRNEGNVKKYMMLINKVPTILERAMTVQKGRGTEKVPNGTFINSIHCLYLADSLLTLLLFHLHLSAMKLSINNS